jgi:hypothetical protein
VRGNARCGCDCDSCFNTGGRVFSISKMGLLDDAVTVAASRGNVRGASEARVGSLTADTGTESGSVAGAGGTMATVLVGAKAADEIALEGSGVKATFAGITMFSAKGTDTGPHDADIDHIVEAFINTEESTASTTAIAQSKI